MRHVTIASLTGLVLVLAMAASPVPDSERGQEFPLVEAQTFAQQLHFVLAQIERDYVRELAPSDLTRAAIEGLFDAARMPVPDELVREVLVAEKPEELVAILARARQRVGDSPYLRGRVPLVASLEGVTRLLDPHCAVVRGEELRRGQGQDLTKGFGLEVEDRKGDGTLVVRRVVLGGPAQRGGLRPGDEITHVDGRKLGTGSTVEHAFALQSGGVLPVAAAESTTGDVPRTHLSIVRPGDAASFEVTLEPLEFREETILGVQRSEDNTWNYWLDREAKLAMVRVANLANNTTDELAQVLVQLRQHGLRGLVLDLRSRPGGFLNQAVTASELFVGPGKIASVHGRSGRDTEYVGKLPANADDFALVVLVNGDSSGGAESIAAAIQDNRRGVIVGQRSLGKGSVQTMIVLPVPDFGLKLTTATLTRANGKCLHRFADSGRDDDWGVRPDVESRISGELRVQLKEWWQAQSLRPGSSREALPLDDLACDAQVQHALAVLRDGATNLETQRAARKDAVRPIDGAERKPRTPGTE